MRKGYITVLFSIVISLCFSLMVGLVYGVRENAIRLRAKEAVEISMRSGFSEYHRGILDRYKLLFVDASYGYKIDSMILPEEYLALCIDENLDEEGFTLLGSQDLLKMSVSGVETNRVRFATDNNGEAIKNQAVRWMKYKYGIRQIESLYKAVDSYEAVLSKAEKTERITEVAASAREGDSPDIVKWVEAESEAIFEETDISLLSTLRAVIDDVSDLSNTKVREEMLLENRELNKGNLQSNHVSDSVEDMIFTEYLLSCNSNYLKEISGTVLNYETEYLIAGKFSDSQNLESVVNRLLLSRETSNLLTLYSDKEKMKEIETFADIACTAIASPELSYPLQLLIMAIWSYSESLKDVRALLNGNKVPLIKGSDEWKTTFEAILTFDKGEAGYDRGLTYNDYLRIFLHLEDTDTVMRRFMNLMELNMNELSPDSDFRLDFCFDAWDQTTYIYSRYGYYYTVNRTYDLEDM